MMLLLKIMSLNILAPRANHPMWETDVNAIYISNKWSVGIRPEKLREIFDRSEFIFAVKETRVVGFVRGFTDHYITTHLTEIAIHRDFQRQGIGKALLDSFCETYAHTAIYTESLISTAPFFGNGPLKAKKTLLPFSLKAIKPHNL